VLARTVLRTIARLGSVQVENGASLLLGPWLQEGLLEGAGGYQGPGREIAGRIGLSFDVDFRADVEATDGLLAHLGRLGLAASFACVGHWVREYPRQHQAIVAAGHEIINHTLTHPDNEEIDPARHFHRLAATELRDQVAGAHRIIEDELGVSPMGFRTPHFGYQHTESVYPLLIELGYAFSSSTIASRTPSFGWPYRVANGRLWEVPVSVCPHHPFSSFDTWHFVRKQPSRHAPTDLVRALAGLLEESRPLPLCFYFDPQDAASGGVCHEALGLLAASGKQVGPLGGLIP